MIKCNVTIVGTVSKAAQVRQNKEGKSFTTFGVSMAIPDTNGVSKTVLVSVVKDGAEDTNIYVVGKRIEMAGELELRKRGGTLYCDIAARTANHDSVSSEDGIKGELHMKGTTGKSIEQKTTKSGKGMLVFSAYSGEKTTDGFAFTWVRFVQFDAERPDWLQPKATIEAKGELELSIFNDRLSLGCKLAELKPWEKPAFVSREAQKKEQDTTVGTAF